MRRMYSEQELTNVIKAVFEQELADGALDENVADAVDAYLVEHPVDITALEGQDISCNSVDADATITGAEIVEKMSGYSFVKGASSNITYEYVYCGAVKNGNKLTLVWALKITRTDESATSANLGHFLIPKAVADKLYPVQFGAYPFLDNRKMGVFSSQTNAVDVYGYIEKLNTTWIRAVLPSLGTLTLNTAYYVRYEATFLLNDTLVPEE